MEPDSLRAVVSKQLGRPVRGVTRAVAGCPYGLPAVVETLPYLEDGTPFPTLYYLVCPTSIEAAARAEASGAVARMRARLAADRECARLLRVLEGAYSSRRRELADDAGGGSKVGASLATGIGGVRERGAVKCVHALVAAALAAEAGALGPEAETAAGGLRDCLDLDVEEWCADRRCGTYVPGSARKAVVDVGTNSVRLLVADVQEASRAGGRADRQAETGPPAEVVRRAVVTGLGRDLAPTGMLNEEASARSRAAIEDLVGEARTLEAGRILLAGTSAVREAADGAQFLRRVGESLQVEVRVLSEGEEAELSLRGASTDVRGDAVLLDIGGGSTELARATGEGEVISTSLPLGCVRQTDRWFTADPPSREERDQVSREASGLLTPWAGSFGCADGASSILVGVAGTAVTLACLILGLAHYDPQAIHGTRIRRQEVEAAVEELASLAPEERLAFPCMQEGRERVIVAGGEILLAAMDTLRFEELLVSERDLLDGLMEMLR